MGPVIFRRTASTSERPALSLKATSPRVAINGRAVANEPGDATIATAIVTARASLLMAKCIDDPVPSDQFDTNYFSTSLSLDARPESMFQGPGNDVYTIAIGVSRLSVTSWSAASGCPSALISIKTRAGRWRDPCHCPSIQSALRSGLGGRNFTRAE